MNVVFLDSKIKVHDIILHNVMLLLLELYIKTRDFKIYVRNEEVKGDFVNKWNNIDSVLIETDGKFKISEVKLIEYFLNIDTNLSFLLLSLNTFIDKMSRLDNLNQELFKMKVS